LHCLPEWVYRKNHAFVACAYEVAEDFGAYGAFSFARPYDGDLLRIENAVKVFDSQV
jgi:hypothetical protein